MSSSRLGKHLRWPPLAPVAASALLVICDGHRLGRITDVLEAHDDAMLGDRCSSINTGSGLVECHQCMGIPSCGFDFVTQSCCKPKMGKKTRFSGGPGSSCASSLVVENESYCSEANTWSALKKAAKSFLGDSSDLEACDQELHVKLGNLNVTDEDSKVMSASEGLRVSQAANLSEEGTKNCVSAMLRHAILSEMVANEADEPNVQECVPFKKGEDARRNLERHRAPICCLLRMWHPPDLIQSFHCYAYFPAQLGVLHRIPKLPTEQNFRGLRRRFPGVDERIEASIKSGPLVAKSFNTGKSKSSFMTTADGKFFLKTIRTDSQEEHRNLLKLLHGYSGRKTFINYWDTRGGNSLLNPIFGLYGLTFLSFQQVFILMEDAGMGLVRHENCAVRVYDLKGDSRAEEAPEKANRTKKEGKNVDFKEFEHNFFDITPQECSRLVATVEEDANFLTEHHQIDYSILAQYGGGPECDMPLCTEGVQAGGVRSNCFVTTKGEKLAITIIDYLNKFNFDKKAEGYLPFRGTKMGKFENYGLSIVNFVRDACRMPRATSNGGKS